jgi:hypothetical protein
LAGRLNPNAEFEAFLREHKTWVESKGKKGKRAQLIPELYEPQLQNLSGSDLRDADLRQALLFFAGWDHVDLSGAKLGGAFLVGSVLSNSCLARADLTGALLTCEFGDQDCFELPGTSNVHTNLTGVDLTNAQLKDATFDGIVDVKGAIFEPLTNPVTRGIANAKNLEFLTYRDNPSALVELRKQFQDNGFRDQERKITYALKRREAQRTAPVERWFNTVAFDWTSQYGMSPGLPMLIWLWLLLLSWIVYIFFIHFPGKSGIYRMRKGEKQEQAEMEEHIYLRWPRPWWRDPLRVAGLEARAARTRQGGRWSSGGPAEETRPAETHGTAPSVPNIQSSEQP